MKTAVTILAIIICVLIIAFIGWLTGGSVLAIFAGVFILLFAGLSIAEKAKLLTQPAAVKTISGWVITLCLSVIVLILTINWWEARKLQTKEDKKQMANATVCKNENGNWISIPSSFRKNSDTGECTDEPVSSTLATSNTGGSGKTVKGTIEQSCTTPCSMNLGFGKLLWTKERPILFRKKGQGTWVNFNGFDNETGDFEFKSPDPKNEVTIEVTSK